MRVATATRIRPADAASCAQALAEAGASGRSVRVRGAGSKDHLGELRPTDVVLETTGMSGVVDHVAADLTVTIAAGMPFSALQERLRAAGQFVPLDPPHGAQATVGGIVASGSDGFGRWRYGGVRDLLIGTVTALCDGTVARSGGRVVKNVAGYDLNKLLIGSLGTLGVIAECTLKVLPLPAAAAAASARAAGPAEAFAIADALVRTSIRPTAAVVDRSGGRWRVTIAAAGDAALVARAMAEVSRAARAAGTSAEETDMDVIDELRELPATSGDGALVRAALPLAAQRSFCASAAALDGVVRIVADAAAGVVHVHLAGEETAVVHGSDTLVAGAQVLGGSARIERRGEGLRDRIPAWPGSPPPGMFLMKRIKQAFDPAGILEPGRSAVG